MVGYAGQSCLCERRRVVGQASRAESGEDAEGEVEASHEDACGQTHRTGWDAEVRDEPEGSRAHMFCDAGNECV